MDVSANKISRDDTYVVGVDFGTLSARALVARVSDGAEAGTAVWEYAHGVIDRSLAGHGELPPDWALQDPPAQLTVDHPVRVLADGGTRLGAVADPDHQGARRQRAEVHAHHVGVVAPDPTTLVSANIHLPALSYACSGAFLPLAPAAQPRGSATRRPPRRDRRH